jgi:hypothetical protein
MYEWKTLKEFPFGFTMLKALEELCFDHCKVLRSILEGLGGLICLKELRMHECEALEEFPSGVTTPRTLEFLSFRGRKASLKELAT